MFQTKFLIDLLRQAARHDYQAVHLEPRGDKTLIRYRQGDNLSPYLILDNEHHDFLAQRLKLMANLDLNSNYPQEGWLSIEDQGQQKYFEVFTFPSSGQEKIVLKPFAYELDKWLEQIKIAAGGGIVWLADPAAEAREKLLAKVLERFSQSGAEILHLVNQDIQARGRVVLNSKLDQNLYQWLKNSQYTVLVSPTELESGQENLVKLALTGKQILWPIAGQTVAEWRRTLEAWPIANELLQQATNCLVLSPDLVFQKKDLDI